MPGAGIEVDTPHGRARARVQRGAQAGAALVLGHGAAGSVSAPDLVAARAAALDAGLAVALVEQPYLVAGRRRPPQASTLDGAWLAVLEQLGARSLSGLPLIVGGRSSGARVACRTAGAAGAIAVLCLAFPLHAPGRAATPASARLAELDAVRVPTLVVQGARDPFGIPPSAPHRAVVRVPGDHRLSSDTDAVAAAVREWLAGLAGWRQTASSGRGAP